MLRVKKVTKGSTQNVRISRTKGVAMSAVHTVKALAASSNQFSTIAAKSRDEFVKITASKGDGRAITRSGKLMFGGLDVAGGKVQISGIGLPTELLMSGMHQPASVRIDTSQQFAVAPLTFTSISKPTKITLGSICTPHMAINYSRCKTSLQVRAPSKGFSPLKPTNRLSFKGFRNF